MNFFKRIKNIWQLSEIVDEQTQEEISERIEEKAKPPQMAQVIKKANPIEEFLK